MVEIFVIVYFLLDQEITPSPGKNTNLEINLASSSSLTKDESE